MSTGLRSPDISAQQHLWALHKAANVLWKIAVSMPKVIGNVRLTTVRWWDLQSSDHEQVCWQCETGTAWHYELHTDDEIWGKKFSPIEMASLLLLTKGEVVWFSLCSLLVSSTTTFGRTRECSAQSHCSGTQLQTGMLIQGILAWDHYSLSSWLPGTAVTSGFEHDHHSLMHCFLLLSSLCFCRLSMLGLPEVLVPAG